MRRLLVSVFALTFLVGCSSAAEEPEVRVNRLNLLNAIRSATLAVADFSKVSG